MALGGEGEAITEIGPHDGDTDDERPEHDGLSGFIGLFDGLLTNEEIDEMVDHICAGRERDRYSPPRVDFSDLLE